MFIIYEKLKKINELYKNAEDNYKDNYSELNRYLNRSGLIKRSNPTRAKIFKNKLKHELPLLNKVELKDVYTTFLQLLFKLQTGDLIPLTELIYIKNKSFPLHLIEVILNYQEISNYKKGGAKSKPKSKSKSKSKSKLL